MSSPPAGKSPQPGINIYGCASVNPYKLTIAAEELGVAYNYINIDMGSGEMKEDWYTAINPNGRLPSVAHVKDDGTIVTIFESGPCLLYLVDQFDKEHKFSYPAESPEYWTQLSWLFWQVAGYGPMMGQACYFNRYAIEPVPYASKRYTAEARRLHSVLDKQLSSQPFVVGDRLTVADIAIFMFAHSSQWCGVDIDESPNIRSWHDKLLNRPAFQRGLQTPVVFPFSDTAVTKKDIQDNYTFMRKMGGQMIYNATEQWNREVVSVPSDHANHAGN